MPWNTFTVTITYAQCGLGSNSGVFANCELSLLSVLFPALRAFPPDTLVFPSHKKTDTSKLLFDLEFTNRFEQVLMISTPKCIVGKKFTIVYIQ